jgi:hypothetical protein
VAYRKKPVAREFVRRDEMRRFAQGLKIAGIAAAMLLGVTIFPQMALGDGETANSAGPESQVVGNGVPWAVAPQEANDEPVAFEEFSRWLDGIAATNGSPKDPTAITGSAPLTWYHKFNSKWHMATEAWYMCERDVPNVAGNVVDPITPEIGANGAFCKTGALRCTAPEYAIVNYVNREFSSKFMMGFRSDFLDDKKGQRTGFATKYTENTLYATRYIGSTIMLRPELRFDHSWDLPAYNGGRARNQFFFGMDLIYKF